MLLTEVRKEDDLYYNGVFWIVADSVKDILKGKFKLVGKKFEVDYDGNYLNPVRGKEMTHKYIWENEFTSTYNNVPFNFYPRLRCNVYKGQVFINLHSLINLPKVIDAVTDACNYHKLNNGFEIDNNDEEQGSHYNFLLD